MNGLVADLTADLLWAPDVATAQLMFRRLCANAGIETFAYGRLLPDGSGPSYTDIVYPAEWTLHYFQHNYWEFDPVVLEARRTPLPFAWRFLTARPNLSEAQRRLFREAADFGIQDGVTIPFHSAAGRIRGMMSMAFESATQMQRVLAAQTDLRLLGVYYDAAIERLMEEKRTEDQASPLSAFECQCLTWAAAGRSLWDIAAALHRAVNEVEQTLRSAREKLGTATTAQTVARAIAQGLIVP